MAVGSELAQLLEARRRKEQENGPNESNTTEPPSSPPKPSAVKPWPPSMTSKPASKQPTTTFPSVNKLSQDKFSSPKSSNGSQKFGGQSTEITPQKTWSPQQTRPQSTKSEQSYKSIQQSQPRPTFPSQSPKQQKPEPPQQPTVRAPSPTTNKQWDQINLDKGIPTPSFLVEMRKNLKKRDGTSGEGVNAGDGRVGGSVGGVEIKNGPIKSAANTATEIGKEDGMESKLDSSDSLKQSAIDSSKMVDDSSAPHTAATALENKSLNNQNKPSIAASVSASNSSTSPRHNELSARRSRLVARVSATESDSSRLKEPTSPGAQSEVSASGTYGNNKSNQRRERILAKVRANTNKSTSSNNSQSTPQQQRNDQSIPSKQVQSPALAAKIKVTTPYADEVEMLFAHEGFQISNSGDYDLGDIPMTRKESMDSISVNEVHQNTSKQSSLAVAKNTQGVNETSEASNYTPQKSKLNGSEQQRLHMASTPKIRGNCQHRRDKFDNEKSETVLLQEKQELQQAESPEEEDAMPSILDSNLITKQVPRRGSYSHGNSNTPNSNLMFHPSPQSQTQYLIHPDDENPQNIHHTYPLNERAPSTISAISGLSNPSCFPQDHLQQPMLGGGGTGFNSYSGSSAFMNAAAIKESTSFNSANSGMSEMNRVGNLGGGGGGGFVNVGNNNLSSSPRGIGLSAFSTRVENENRRLREQLNAAQKKVEEKDAIISQLMKRIADLEHSHAISSINGSAPREVTSKTNGIRSYSMDQDSYAMSSLWDHSRPASDVYAPAPSFHANRSPSADAESISMSSPPHHLSVKTITKQSPITTLTSSTASVTTASSSKSHHQRGNSSKSLPGQQGSVGRMRRSSYRKGGVNNNAGGDDRRFQC